MKEKFCPKCNIKLNGRSNESGFFWSCPVCSGKAISLPVIRKKVLSGFLNNIWQKALISAKNRSFPCPMCGNSMYSIDVSNQKNKFSLDICTGCQFIWFDDKEFESLPRLPERIDSEISEIEENPEIRKALAILKSKELATQMSDGSEEDNGWQENIWAIVYILLRIFFHI